MKQNTRFYRPELDVLRFFAFLAVYISHTSILDPTIGRHRFTSQQFERIAVGFTRSGRYGVDLFFVLSSYLITELLLRERDATGSINIAAFYIRRMLRIWPLFILILVLSVILHSINHHEQMTWQYALGFFFFCGNWMLIFKPIISIASPLWSVAIEEQFYILWPRVVRSASRKKLMAITFSLFALSLCARLGLSLHDIKEPGTYFNTFARLDPICAGVMVALLLNGRIPTFYPAIRLLLGLSGASLVLVIGANFNLMNGPVIVWRQVSGYVVVALGCTLVLIAILGISMSPGAKRLATPFIYLGRISYGLYVWHLLGLLIASAIVPNHGAYPLAYINYWLVGLATTILLAAISYRWIETPFLRLKQRRYTVVSSQQVEAT